MSDVTPNLSMIKSGEQQSAEQLLPLVYNELRKLAAARMALESPDHTLQPTALVHEAFVRLVDTEKSQHWNSRGHFYAAAAEAMRRILIEAARKRTSLKRGGQFRRIVLDDNTCDAAEWRDWVNLLALDEALQRLKIEDSDCYQLVMLRFFSGLTVDEAARSLGVSPRTAKRNWSFARAWLQREIDRMDSEVGSE